MIASSHIPPPPLSNFVEFFWYYEGLHVEHARDRVLPDGSTQLIINLHEDRLRVYDREDTSRFDCYGGSLVCGPRSEFTIVDASHQSIIGVAFKPGGAFPFLKLPVSDLRNLQVPLEEFWKAGAGRLREQLLEAESPAARFAVLERSLLEQSAGLWRHPAVALALKEFDRVPHTRPIAEITDQLGLSPRRFIQAFDSEVGLTPKLFCRIRRFQEVLRTVAPPAEIDWAGVAARCGYFDQDHFIHDFRAFAGISPATYAAARGEFQNHVALPNP